MRHRYPIINLHDTPMYHRPSMWSHRYAAPHNSGSMLLVALSALLILGGGVVAYADLFRSTLPEVPVLTPHTAYYDKRAEALRLVAPPAPAPDMDSPAVALADADVPREQVAHVRAMFKQPEPAAQQNLAAAETEQKPSRPVKKVHTARRLSPDAANSYASESDVFRPPFGGW